MSKMASQLSPTIVFPTWAGGEEEPTGHYRLKGSQIDVDYTYSISADPGKTSQVSIEIRVANTGALPIQVVRIENVIPGSAQVIEISPSTVVVDRSMIPTRKSTPPMKVETFHVTLNPKNGPLIIGPSIVYAEENGREKSYELPQKVVASSPLLDYLADELTADYRKNGLALEHSGWRTLTSIAAALKIPRSHLYGEPRWGHTYGKPLEVLVKSGIVECRTFPRGRGRGGQIRRARLACETQIGRRFLEERGQTVNKSLA